jgi:hypothetical protein
MNLPENGASMHDAANTREDEKEDYSWDWCVDCPENDKIKRFLIRISESKVKEKWEDEKVYWSVIEKIAKDEFGVTLS